MLKFFLSFAFLITRSFENVDAQNRQILTDKQSNEDSLKILSWNIYMLPPLVKFTGKRKRATAIGKELAKTDYDVLVLEEAFNPGARKKLRKELKHVFPYEKGPTFVQPFSLKTSDGIWILSKYPVKRVGATRFERSSGIDNRMARKGALMVEINKDGQKFQVIGTHLNSGGTLQLRTGQLKQIKEELVDRYHQDNVPVIIAGDFNIDKYEDGGLDSMLTALNVDDYELEGKIKHTYDHTKNDLEPGKTKGVIDYIYLISRGYKMRNVKRQIPIIERSWSKGRKSLSDHNPVELSLFFNVEK
ncbi:MAG: sphingomyelin phosphodiesterase [Chitinophagales bacterium]|nr:sphingomyelin phosphodiesterase [Chitinophagales bacterium]